MQNIVEENNLENAKVSTLQGIISWCSNLDLCTENSITSHHEEITSIIKTELVDLQVSCTLQYDFKAQFKGSILKDDFRLVFNEESIFGAGINLIDRLVLENIETISSNEGHELRIKEDEET